MYNPVHQVRQMILLLDYSIAAIPRMLWHLLSKTEIMGTSHTAMGRDIAGPRHPEKLSGCKGPDLCCQLVFTWITLLYPLHVRKPTPVVVQQRF